ncbi:MAG: hypothetical protein ACT4P6_20280 [Gemmatimonadaceae bacterium]
MKRVLLATALPIALACGDADHDAVSPNTFADGLVAIVENVSAAGWPRDALDVTSAEVIADTLRLGVQFGGGCATHRFALLLGSAFMESHPVQVHARLAHAAGGDMCKALLTRDVAFDLTPLKQRYRASYGAGPAAIVINLVGHATSVRYSFN